MFKRLALTLCLFCLPAQSAPILGEGPAFPGPDWRDDLPVRVLIDPALNGSTQEQSFKFTVDFANFLYEPEAATSLPASYADGTKRSNAGHFHYYASLVGVGFRTTNVFGGAPAGTLLDPDTLEFTIELPDPGLWLIYVEAQYDDHTSRVRPHPQQIGAWDAAFVNVVPEPSTAMLLALAGACVFRRKR